MSGTGHGWASSDRRSRLPSNWAELRVIVLRLCGRRCEWVEDGWRCAARATEVDHKRPGDDHSLDNLQGLCHVHHTAKTQREAAEARRRRRYRPRETHPAFRR